MTPTEEICARLDELGVEYDTYDLPNGEHGVSWIDGNNIEWEAVQQGENFRIHALQLVTPEQAIAATLGAGTCHMRHRTGLEPDETKRYVPDKTCHMVLMEDISWHAYQDTYECDRCGEQVIRETYMGKSEPPNFCPNCGARIEKGKDDGMGQE